MGNSKTCRVVGKNCAEGGKRFLGMGSAKNHLVVMPDAKVDEVIRKDALTPLQCMMDFGKSHNKSVAGDA